MEGYSIAELEHPSESFVFANFRPRFRVNETENATLIILNVSRSDEGEYRCRVQDDQRDESSIVSISLDVQCK